MSLVSTFPPLRHGYKPNRKTRLKSLSASQAAQNVSFWLLGVESRDFSQAEKERIACKDEQISKLTTIFTQNGLRSRLCKDLNLVQTHNCSLLIMGLHIFEIKLC